MRLVFAPIAQLVEHSAVNRSVLGPSPSGGALNAASGSLTVGRKITRFLVEYNYFRKAIVVKWMPRKVTAFNFNFSSFWGAQ